MITSTTALYLVLAAIGLTATTLQNDHVLTHKAITRREASAVTTDSVVDVGGKGLAGADQILKPWGPHFMGIHI